MKTRRHNNRRGFTLVELSIVLVIIGLIIGGVLTGQQIIQNARITNALNTVQAYEAQFQTYVQNYGALPGDDTTALTRFPNATGIKNGNGNGAVDGAFDSTVVTDESVVAWIDLRAAGLVKSQVGSTNQPPNPFNGIFGFQNGAFSGAFTGTALCLSNVPAGAAQAIDSRLDDGDPSKGNLRSSVTGATGTTVTDYSADGPYTMCIRM